MRIPFIRLGSDKRPLAPWEERLRPFVSAILIVPLFAGVIIGTIFVVAFFLGWTLVSPVLPRSWRILLQRWKTRRLNQPFDMGKSIKLGSVLFKLTAL